MNPNTKRIPGRRVLKLALKEYNRTLDLNKLLPRYAAHMKARDAMNELLVKRGLFSSCFDYTASCLGSRRLKNKHLNRLGRVALSQNSLVSLDDLYVKLFWNEDLRKVKFIHNTYFI